MVQVRFRMSHEREGPAGGRHRRRHRAAVAAPNRVTMSVLLTVLTGLAAGCSPTGSATPAQPLAPSATQSASAPAPGTWRRIAAAPIPPAGGMAAAWTGRQLVVWGGQSGDGRQPAGDGAAYDPGADRWEVLAPAPVAARFGATAVWTGREVLFWGGQGGPGMTLADGAAYDPATRHWRALPPAPIGPRTSHEAVWTGKEMVVWGGFAHCCPIDSVIHDPAAAAYDPATDRWRRIADIPPPWSGDDGTAVTMVRADPRPGPEGQSVDGVLIWRRNHLAAYDPATDAWSETPGVPPEPRPGDPSLPSTTGDPFAVGAASDHDVFTWTGKSAELQGVAWRPSDGTWRRTATLEAQAGGSLAAGGPDRIYAAAGQSARVLEYRIGEDRWEELPLPPIATRSAATLVWTGSELLFWGGIGDEGPEMDGATWHCC
jgi:galactose oxidase-like protein